MILVQREMNPSVQQLRVLPVLREAEVKPCLRKPGLYYSCCSGVEDFCGMWRPRGGSLVPPRTSKQQMNIPLSLLVLCVALKASPSVRDLCVSSGTHRRPWVEWWDEEGADTLVGQLGSSGLCSLLWSNASLAGESVSTALLEHSGELLASLGRGSLQRSSHPGRSYSC